MTSNARFCRRRLASLGSVLAVVALSAFLLPTSPAEGQNCFTGALGDGPGIPDEKLVHLGDSVHFYIHLNADDSACKMDGGTNWVILPDGTVHQILGPYAKPTCGVGSALTVDCPGGPGCNGDVTVQTGPSGFLRFEYGPIKPDDVARRLPIFITPRGSEFTSQSGLSLAGQVWIGAISDARTTDCNDSTIHDQATAQGVTHVTIVHPRISVTKQCVSNCAPASANTPVGFAGKVCNMGDISLTNITVSDGSDGTSITFSNQTSLGNPFPIVGGGRLVPGDCISYAGVFSPVGNPCGPFPTIVMACGTDQSSIPLTLCATNGAVTILGARREGKDFAFSFAAAGQNQTYTVQFTDSLSPANWQTVTNLPADCTVVTIRNSVTNAQRFYRVLPQ